MAIADAVHQIDHYLSNIACIALGQFHNKVAHMQHEMRLYLGAGGIRSCQGDIVPILPSNNKRPGEQCLFGDVPNQVGASKDHIHLSKSCHFLFRIDEGEVYNRTFTAAASANNANERSAGT